jgi:hypothetical protein
MSDAVAEQDARRARLMALLEPFPADQVGKLPRVTCRECSGRGKRCDEHKPRRCETCKAYVSPKHIHIDYIGHADVTRKLLETDHEWSWEPFALDDNGLPHLDTDEFGNPVGMWIRLTILGITRPGYGSCPSNQSDAVKVLIGDALRNAAMRFGVALDLWSKTDRDNPAAENPVADAGQRAMPPRQRAADAQVVVDGQWVEVFERNLAQADIDAAPGFRQEVITAMRGGIINSPVANRLLDMVKDRIDALNSVTKSGLPANKDGSVARSKLTDDELAANGLMTGPEVRAHGRLVKDVTALDKPTEHLPASPPDDPWVNPAPEQNNWPPVAKPGSDGAA